MNESIKISELREWIKNKQLSSLESFFENEQATHYIYSNRHLLIIYCLYLALKGDIDRARVELGAKADSLEDGDGALLSDLGLLWYIFGEIDKAKSALQKAIERGTTDEATWARLGAIHFTQGQLDLAEQCWLKSLEKAPGRVEVLYNLGVIHFNRGDLQQAIDFFNRALRQDPNFHWAEEKKIAALVAQHSTENLIEEYYSLIESDPNNSTNFAKLIYALKCAERYEQAITILYQAVRKFPGEFRFKQDLVGLLWERGALFQAGSLVKEWLEERDWLNEVEEELVDGIVINLRFLLNELRIEAGFLDKAKEDLGNMEKKGGTDSPRWYCLQSKIFMEENRGVEAAEILRRGREKFPYDIELLKTLGHTLASLGEMEEAKKVAKTVYGINPSAFIQQLEFSHYEATDAEVELLTRLVENRMTAPDVRASAAFVLHKVLDKRGDYRRAFDTLRRANEIVKRGIDYDWKDHRKMVQKTLEIFDHQLVESLQGLGDTTRRPIFVLGMPRSGTTLTEQILGAHPLVYPAGELGFVPRIINMMPKVVPSKAPWPEAMLDINGDLLASAARYYLKRVNRLDCRHRHTVDKLPHNFDYIGLILLMFPNAKIIHLNRDPLDVALSNYQQNFAAKHGVMGFAFDLVWIGHMLNDHDAVMEHWRRLFPDKIYELHYDSLVQEPELVIRELLEFCELPWNEAVLEFYRLKRPVKTASIQQVRQGIYRSSVAKWKRYEEELAPVRELLKEGYFPLEHDGSSQWEETVLPMGHIGVTAV